MPILLKTRRHLLTRLLPWFLFCFFIAVLPFIIGIGGSYLSVLITGEPCGNEGQCPWDGFMWLSMFSIPIGVVLFHILVIIAIIDGILHLIKK